VTATEHTAPTRPVGVRVAGDLYHGRVPRGAVYVGRAAPGIPASKYANPHRPADRCHVTGGLCPACKLRHADPASAVAAYDADIDQTPHLLAVIRAELAGRNLACWCPVGTPCHRDVLLRRANPVGSRA
jgi:hypothetical protein